MTRRFYGRMSPFPFPFSLNTERIPDQNRKKDTLEESRDWLVNMILPTKETWDIDKYALLLKDEKNEKGGLKMVGFVGTNRWCEKGMEVGYCSNVGYWGTGYITEGFKAFLELYWTLPGTSISFLFLHVRNFNQGKTKGWQKG